MKFEVGQIWITGRKDKYEITEIRPEGSPYTLTIKAKRCGNDADIEWFMPNGQYFTDKTSDRDLIHLAST